MDLGGHGRVGLVHLENARRPAQVARVDGDVGLERLGVVLDGGAAIVVERADLLHGLPAESRLEVGRVLGSLAHLRVVGRVGDDALGRQQLHPQEVADELALEDRVELGLASGETGPAKCASVSEGAILAAASTAWSATCWRPRSSARS